MRSTKITAEAQGLILSLLTLFLGLAGACMGYLFGFASVEPPLGVQEMIWLMGWTIIGSVQGACMVPAWNLGRGEDLRSFSGVLLTFSAVATSMVSVSLWAAMGRSGPLSLVMALGLLSLSSLPLCTYCFARRSLSPAVPAGI